MDNLISILHEKGLLNEDAAGRARALLTEGKTLEEAIVAADGVTEEQMLKFLAGTFEVPFVDLEKNPPTKEFLQKFPARVLLRHHLLPLEERDGVTLVATSRISETAGVICMNLFALRAHRSTLKHRRRTAGLSSILCLLFNSTSQLVFRYPLNLFRSSSRARCNLDSIVPRGTPIASAISS